MSRGTAGQAARAVPEIGVRVLSMRGVRRAPRPIGAIPTIVAPRGVRPAIGAGVDRRGRRWGGRGMPAIIAS